MENQSITIKKLHLIIIIVVSILVGSLGTVLITKINNNSVGDVDLFDGLTGEINTNLNIAENNIEKKIKKVYISDKVGKVLIFFLLVLLFFIWFNYLNKGIL